MGNMRIREFFSSKACLIWTIFSFFLSFYLSLISSTYLFLA